MDKTTANAKMLVVYSNCFEHKLASYSCQLDHEPHTNVCKSIYYTSCDVHMQSLKFIVDCVLISGVMLGLSGATI